MNTVFEGKLQSLAIAAKLSLANRKVNESAGTRSNAVSKCYDNSTQLLYDGMQKNFQVKCDFSPVCSEIITKS